VRAAAVGSTPSWCSDPADAQVPEAMVGIDRAADGGALDLLAAANRSPSWTARSAPGVMATALARRWGAQRLRGVRSAPVVAHSRQEAPVRALERPPRHAQLNRAHEALLQTRAVDSPDAPPGSRPKPQRYVGWERVRDRDWVPKGCRSGALSKPPAKVPRALAPASVDAATGLDPYLPQCLLQDRDRGPWGFL